MIVLVPLVSSLKFLHYSTNVSQIYLQDVENVMRDVHLKLLPELKLYGNKVLQMEELFMFMLTVETIGADSLNLFFSYSFEWFRLLQI